MLRQPLAGFAQETSFGPLGIERAAWPADPEGINYGFGDLHFSTHDLVRLGGLYLDGG